MKSQTETEGKSFMYFSFENKHKSHKFIID